MAGPIPANVLTPKVATFHWDDLAQVFVLKVTFQLVTPLGIFQREIRITAANLAAAIGDLLAAWGAAPTGTEYEDFGVTYPFGDLATVATLPVPAFVPQVFPVTPVTDIPDFTDWVPIIIDWG